MRQLVVLAVFIPALLATGVKTVSCLPIRKDSAQEVLAKVVERLGSLKSIRYRYQAQFHYESEGRHLEREADCFLDFTSRDTLTGVRYQFHSTGFIAVFNGSEQFHCQKKTGTMTINRNPTRNQAGNAPFLYNSLFSLRNALPAILGDVSVPKTLSDTVVGNARRLAIGFELHQKWIGYAGNMVQMTENRKTRYLILIDPGTYLPVDIIQSNNVNQDYTRVQLSGLQVNASLPEASIWNSAGYLRSYKLERPELKKRLIAAGEPAPDWRLPVFGSDTAVSRSGFRGKVVLLEFWDRNCGYCVAAVPQLNELYRLYSREDFRLLAINTHDPREAVGIFKEKLRPEYPVLYDGQQVADAYGVAYYPLMVLIDKEGNVIYSGEFRPEVLRPLIRKNL
jgi:peroxiredoxin